MAFMVVVWAKRGVGIREVFCLVMMNEHYLVYCMVIVCGKVYGLWLSAYAQVIPGVIERGSLSTLDERCGGVQHVRRRCRQHADQTS